MPPEPGPVQAERFSEDYHGTHAKPARPVPLDWHEATGRMEAARVLAHTCECRPVLPELCSRGGGDLIRRDRHRLEGRCLSEPGVSISGVGPAAGGQASVVRGMTDRPASPRQ